MWLKIVSEFFFSRVFFLVPVVTKRYGSTNRSLTLCDASH